MKKILTGILVLVLMVAGGSEVYAKCEAALKRLKQAEANLAAANAEYEKASGDHKQAQANFNKAIQDLNAIAAKLGASGRATRDSGTFGRSPSNPTFFDDPGYKAAKQAWQDAKEANQKAEGDLDQAGIKRKRAQDEYADAEAEYERLRAEHVGDAGFLRTPEPLKIDETLSDEVEKVTELKRSRASVKHDDAYLDFSFVLKKIKDRTILETSIIAIGKGSRYRKWLPRGLKLNIDSAAVDPIEMHDYYISRVHKEPAAASSATSGILTALGSQYTGGAKKQSHYKSDACPPGTQQDAKPQGTAIGSAGMAVGLGLLTSQPREKITGKKIDKIKGLRASFDVTGYEDRLDGAKIDANIVNEIKGEEADIIVPIHFDR